jgi:hypothetical protein
MYWIQTHEKQKAQQGVPPYSAQGALPVTADVGNTHFHAAAISMMSSNSKNQVNPAKKLCVPSFGLARLNLSRRISSADNTAHMITNLILIPPSDSDFQQRVAPYQRGPLAGER